MYRHAWRRSEAAAYCWAVADSNALGRRPTSSRASAHLVFFLKVRSAITELTDAPPQHRKLSPPMYQSTNARLLGRLVMLSCTPGDTLRRYIDCIFVVSSQATIVLVSSRCASAPAFVLPTTISASLKLRFNVAAYWVLFATSIPSAHVAALLQPWGAPPPPVLLL